METIEGQLPPGLSPAHATHTVRGWVEGYLALRLKNTCPLSGLVVSEHGITRVALSDASDDVVAKVEFAIEVQATALACEAEAIILVSQAVPSPEFVALAPSNVMVVQVETAHALSSTVWEVERDEAGAFVRLGRELMCAQVPAHEIGEGALLAGLLPDPDLLADDEVRREAALMLAVPEHRRQCARMRAQGLVLRP